MNENGTLLHGTACCRAAAQFAPKRGGFIYPGTLTISKSSISLSCLKPLCYSNVLDSAVGQGQAVSH